MRPVPGHIVAPMFAATGRAPQSLTSTFYQLLPFLPPTNSVHLHSEREIKRAAASAELAAKVLDFAGTLAVPGTTTDAIDQAVHEQTIAAGAVSTLNAHSRVAGSNHLSRAVSIAAELFHVS